MFDFILQLYTSKSLTKYYQALGTMTRYSDYTLTEIENMIPYEMEIYSAILIKQLKEEKQKRDAKRK